MNDRPENAVYNVLFVCTGNSARSIIAEAILNRVGRGRFKAFSAGSHPKGRIHPYALDLLQQLHFDVSGLRSKSWTEFAVSDAPKLDFVFTVCDSAAGETCPVWPRQPGPPITAHWIVPDPAEAEGSSAEIALAFKRTYRLLGQRIGMFNALPLRSLDQLGLQNRLREIGNMKDRG
jgi:protein-tyrosine-phosphatase